MLEERDFSKGVIINVKYWRFRNEVVFAVVCGPLRETGQRETRKIEVRRTRWCYFISLNYVNVMSKHSNVTPFSGTLSHILFLKKYISQEKNFRGLGTRRIPSSINLPVMPLLFLALSSRNSGNHIWIF